MEVRVLTDEELPEAVGVVHSALLAPTGPRPEPDP